MDFDLLIRVAGVGLTVCAAYMIVKKAGGEEQAMLISLVGVVMVLLMLVGKISELLDLIRSLFRIMMMKICGGALLVAFVTLLIRQLKPEMTMPVTVTGAVILLLAVVGMLAPQIEYINGLWYAEELRGYATPLVKSLGVALVAQTASDLCRDMGENSAASKVEFAGKLEIMLICLPLIDKLLEFARGLLLG